MSVTENMTVKPVRYVAEQYTMMAGTARSAAEKSAEMWKQGAQSMGTSFSLPTVDFTAGVDRYFDFVQKAVEANRRALAGWAQAFSSMTGVATETVTTMRTAVVEQTEKVADLVVETAATAENLAQETAAQAEEQATKAKELADDQAAAAEKAVRDQAAAAEKAARAEAAQVEKAAKEREEARVARAAEKEEAEKEAARAARAAERKAAKEAHEEARAKYDGKTKAELSDLLAERELPKSGNLDELVERLVEADTSK